MNLWQEFRDSLSSVIAFPADYFAGWFGVAPSESGVQVNELTAMQIAAYVGCVRIISDAISCTPMVIYERMADGTERHAKDHLLYPVLRNQPNDEVSAADLRQTGQAHVLMTGNCFQEIAYNGAGQPAALYLRNPFQTVPYRRQDGALIYKTKEGSMPERTIEAKNMIHVKGLGMDSLVGLSPVKYYAREVLGNDLAVQSYSSKFFANDSRPGGYLKYPGPRGADQKLNDVKTWLAGHSRGQAHQMAVLDSGASWEKVGVAPEEAQFIQTRQLNARQLGTIFGVPMHFLGDSEASRANMEQRALEFLIFTMRPWFNKWEGAYNMRLFPSVGRNAGRFYCKFDTTQFERATYADLLRGVQMGRYAGIYTIDEGRALLGEQPYSEKQLKSTNIGDKLWQPVNMVVVTPAALSGNLPTQVIDNLDKPNESGKGGKGQGGNDQSGGDGAGASPKAGSGQGGKRADQEIAHYFRVFSRSFDSAFGRLLVRKKRSEQDFQEIFEPILTSIAAAFRFNPEAEPGEMDLPADLSEFIRSYIGAMAQRGSQWTKQNSEGAAGIELRRAIEVMREKCAPPQMELEDRPEEPPQRIELKVPITLNTPKRKRKVKLIKTPDGTTTGAEIMEE